MRMPRIRNRGKSGYYPIEGWYRFCGGGWLVAGREMWYHTVKLQEGRNPLVTFLRPQGRSKVRNPRKFDSDGKLAVAKGNTNV